MSDKPKDSAEPKKPASAKATSKKPPAEPKAESKTSAKKQPAAESKTPTTTVEPKKPTATVIEVPKTESASESAPTGAPSGPRAAQLRVSHVDPWSATRVAFAVSCAMTLVFVVAAVVFWIVMSITGVFGQVDDAVTSVLSDGSEQFSVSDYFGLGRMIFFAIVLGVVNIVASTALAAIGSRIYNTVAEMVGGVQVTFSDD